VTNPTFDRDSWERRWEQALREHPDMASSRPPNEYLLAEIGGLQPGRALDAGCGHGAEAIWLASAGWRVTAVDFSVTALEHARSTSRALGADIAGRIDWVEGDLGTWAPPPGVFDLVSCLYVHVAGSVGAMVARLGSGVAPGGTLFLVGHLPVDPATGAPSPAAGQNQVTVDAALEALDEGDWEIVVSEERLRSAVGSGVDALVRAVRRPSGTARPGPAM
jgi:SAM-dependent methyltransferase